MKSPIIRKIARFSFVHGPDLAMWLTLAWMLAITAIVGHIEGHY